MNRRSFFKTMGLGALGTMFLGKAKTNPDWVETPRSMAVMSKKPLKWKGFTFVRDSKAPRFKYNKQFLKNCALGDKIIRRAR